MKLIRRQGLRAEKSTQTPLVHATVIDVENCRSAIITVEIPSLLAG